jgi:hypothetical protein
MQQSETHPDAIVELATSTNVMFELVPGDLELGENITKKEAGWDTLLQTFSEILDKEKTVGDVICFNVNGDEITIIKSGNDHLVPRIQEFLEAGIRDMEDIYIGENTESFEWDMADEKLQSSNDALINAECPARLKILSLAVLALQTAVLAVVVSSSHKKDTVKARSADLILVRIFIASYLSFYLSESMSKSFTRMLGRLMQVFVYPFPIGSCAEAMNNVIAAPMALIFVFLFSLCQLLYGLARNPSAGGHWAWCLIIAETIIEYLMLLATSLITKQQNSVVESIFNFVGLLLILDLDELAVKFTSFTVKKHATVSTTVIRVGDNVKFSTSICFFIGLVIFILIY